MSNREEFLQELYSLDSFDDSLNDKMNWACINGWDECVAMLIEKGADGHLFNDYPLTVINNFKIIFFMFLSGRILFWTHECRPHFD